MPIQLARLVPTLVLLGLATACTKEDASTSPKFDAAHIAAEADKGNLDPLKDLNAACGNEVESTGRRAEICAVQDKVRELRKPLNIRF